MNKANFLAFYPQFSSMPEAVLVEYITQANARFGEFCDSAEEARRLYIAHKLTLYAQTFAPAPSEAEKPAVVMSRLAGAGVSAQALSKSVGGVSVSKSEGSATSGLSGYAEWKQTEFGLQLIGLAKTAYAGGRYIP